MPICIGNKRRGIRKLNAKKNLVKNAESVDFHTCFSVFVLSASSEIWMPNASERESAKAIVITPAITANFEFVPKKRPMINPIVVITPEVNPNEIPLFIDFSIFLLGSERLKRLLIDCIITFEFLYYF